MSINNVTINKIGGASMSKPKQVLHLIDVLKKREENVILVVSAFKDVTDALIDAMDELNGKDYSESDIDQAFSSVKNLHQVIFDEHFENDYKNQVELFYQQEYEKLRTSLIFHKSSSTILMPLEGSFQIRDQVIGFGENMGGGCLNILLSQHNHDSESIDNVICQDCDFNGSSISVDRLHKSMQLGIQESLRAASEDMREGVIRILGGHVSGTPRGIGIDIGRSYSDTSAVNAAIAARNIGDQVKSVRFWKAVDGVMTADPNDLGENNHPIILSDVSTTEGLEMASSGNGLMQLDALSLAEENDIILELRNIENPEGDSGTTFSNTEIKTNHAFKSINSNPHIDTISINLPSMANKKGFMSSIADVLSIYNLSVDGIFSEGTSLSFSIPMAKDRSDREIQRHSIRQALAELTTITVDQETYKTKETKWSQDAMASISIVGNELTNNTGILSVITSVLAAYGIDIKSITHGQNQKRITVIIPSSQRTLAVQKLHSIFVDADEEVIRDFREHTERNIRRLTTTF